MNWFSAPPSFLQQLGFIVDQGTVTVDKVEKNLDGEREKAKPVDDFPPQTVLVFTRPVSSFTSGVGALLGGQIQESVKGIVETVKNSVGLMEDGEFTIALIVTDYVAFDGS